MSEAETRAELINPALRDAGWGVVEAVFAGKSSSLVASLVVVNVLKQDSDYVLVYCGKNSPLSKLRNAMILQGRAEGRLKGFRKG
jgi:type I restriction enzyme, R subunit